MSRTTNVVRNMKFSIINYIVQTVLQFLLRTVIIYVLGKQYLGINGLFGNLLGILNLAELGIGSAIVFSMYKPIAENDTEKLKSLNNLYKKIYIVIASIILGVGIMLLPFIEHFISGEIPKAINIYIIYLIYLINTVISYFAAHKRSLLFAYQRKDIDSKIHMVLIISLYAVQIILLTIFKNFYCYITLLPFFTFAETLVIVKSANKLFPDINGKAQPLDPTTKKGIIKNISAMSMHKLGDVLVNSTDNLIISAFLGLALVGIYNNYSLIVSNVASVLILISSSMHGSVGNLIATSNKEYVYEKYKSFNFAFSWLIGFCSICLFCLFQNFIRMWTQDTSYLLSFASMVIIVLNFYVTTMKYVTRLFKNSAGLMWHDRWKPIVQGIVNIVLSIILIKSLGFIGVLIGTFVSFIVAPVWIEPLVLHKYYFKKNLWEYFRKYFFYTLVTIFAGALTYLICSFIPSYGIPWFILKMSVCLIIPNIIFLIVYLKTKEFKSLIKMLKNILKSRKTTKSKIIDSAKELKQQTDIANNSQDTTTVTTNVIETTSKDV